MKKSTVGVVATAVLSLAIVAGGATAASAKTMPRNEWKLVNMSSGYCSVRVMIGDYYGQGFAKFSSPSSDCQDARITAKVANPVFGPIWLDGCTLWNASTANSCTNSYNGYNGAWSAQSSAPGPLLEAKILLCGYQAYPGCEVIPLTF